MRAHLLLVKIFFVVVGTWLYVIHPTRMPEVLKLGPAPIIEKAARFTFPEVKSSPETNIVKVSGEHRELSLREISSVGKPTVIEKPTSFVQPSSKDVKSLHFQ